MRGFTLIEMLVVLLIVGICLSMSIPFLRNNGNTPSMQVVTLPSLFDSARSIALSRSTKTRVLFQNDPLDAEHYRRWVCIMVQTGVDANGAAVWQAESSPVLFRSGIYYFPAKTQSTTTDPKAVVTAIAGRDSQCLAYEYDETGRTLQPGAAVMLVRGVVIGNKLNVPQPMVRDGFYLRQNGGMTRVERPAQLPAPVE